MGMAMVIRITMMLTTTINSTKVKPRRPRRFTLPLRVWCAIGRFLRRFAVHGKDILAAPGGGLGVVGVAAHSPFLGAGEGIAWYAAQELYFLAIGAGELLPFHQDVQAFRIAVGSRLDGTEVGRVAVVLILVDGVFHFAKAIPQLALARGADARAGQR